MQSLHAQRTRTPDTRTLGEVVAAIARRAPDGLLAAAAALGLIGVALVGFLLRAAWWLTPLLLAIAAFGAWGVADRERSALGARGMAFRWLRALAALVGGVAAAFMAVVLFVVFVGRLIS